MKRSISFLLAIVIVFSFFAVSSFVFAETTSTTEDTSTTNSPMFLGELSGTAYSTEFLTCSDNKNTLANGSFEGTTVLYGKADAANFSGDCVSVSTEKAFEGEKSLKFEAGADEEVDTLVFDVTPNTKYQFSLFMNCSEYTGGADLTFGIADAETGYFIDSEESINFETNISNGNEEYSASAQYSGYYKTYQMSPTAYDNKWHMTGGFFTTGDKTQLAFVMRGKNVTAYLDKFCIFPTEGDVVLGTTHPYWNLAKYWNLNDGVMTFKSVSFSSERHAFILSFRLDGDLTAGNTYTLSTDMTLTASQRLSNFSVYYSDTLAIAASEEATSGKVPTGSTVLYKNYKLEDSLLGFETMPTQSFTFTPESDFSAGGYISVRFFVKGADVTASATEFKLTDSSGTLINSWDFTSFDNGNYTGTGSEWTDAEIKTWFPELTEYDADISSLKNAGGKKYIAPLQNLEHAVLTNETATLLSTTEDKNLVENFDFSVSDTSFWTDNTSATLGDTLKIVNTSHSIQGKSFLYQSNRKYPFGIYYIKWIDVEPDTEYTFSARYSIEETGESFIGIVDGYRNDNVTITQNSVFPKLISKIVFSEDNFIEDYEWQSSGFTFNTKDRNRVGIAICDKGGMAYIDDIRLFKTADAVELTVTEDNIPDTITGITENVTIDEEYVILQNNENTLADFKNNFDFGSNIRVFKADGTELENTDFVGTGMIVKLMNGNVLKDSATVVIKGDINGDGYINAADLTVLKKTLLSETELSVAQSSAADLHTDGTINIIDLVALKKYIVEVDDSITATIKDALLTDQSGVYNIAFELNNFNLIENGGAYYFKIKLPTFLKVESVELNGTALADPDYENETGDYSVDSDNNLILSNFFNTDFGDTFEKLARWDIKVTLNGEVSQGSYQIELAEDSFVLDLEENIIEYTSYNGEIVIK